MMTQEIPEVEA